MSTIIFFISRKLYWTDSDKDVIEVAELNGTNRRVLYHQGMALPRAVAIDPRDGWVILAICYKDLIKVT